MLLSFLYFLKELNDYVATPLTESAIHVVFVTAANLSFYYILHKYLLGRLYLPFLTIGFNVLQMMPFATNLYLKFVIFTCMVFILFLILSLMLADVVTFPTLDHFLKVLIFFFACTIFSIFKDNPHLDDFILTYIMLTLKVLSVSEEIAKITRNNITFRSITIFDQIDVMAYLTNPGWISYKDFRGLRTKQPEKNHLWQSMMLSAASRAMLFHILSFEYMGSEVFNHFCNKHELTALIHTFQFRCKYYYKAQIAELVSLAAGVKRGNWNRHFLFDFKRAETSITLKDFFYAFNLPFSSHFRNRMSVNSIYGWLEFGVHVILVVILIGLQNIYYAFLFFVFTLGIISQVGCIDMLVTTCDACVLTCDQPICRHRFGRRMPIFWIGKFLLVLINHFRISLLFCYFQNSSYGMSLGCTFITVITDIVVMVVLAMKDVDSNVRASRRRRRETFY